MKSQITRNTLFIVLFFISFCSWLVIWQDNRSMAHVGILLFTILAYLVTIYWMLYSFLRIKDDQRYFWLIFAIGVCFLFSSQLMSAIHKMQLGVDRIPLLSVENNIRLVGYLFFFIGFVYYMKVIKNTLPMLRFLLNIIIVIIAAHSVSWYFIINPILEGRGEISQTSLFITSFYHVFNISLVFAAICLVLISPVKKVRISLTLVAIGFLIQVVGDFFHINHVQAGGEWISLSWPLSVLLMGLGAILSNENEPNGMKATEQFEYKSYHMSLLGAGILLLITIKNQLEDTNILEKGLFLTVLLLLLHQAITTVENKQMFKKLKRLASLDGDFPETKTSREKKDEMSKLIQKIENLAHYDPLTGLPNRNLFQKCMERELKAAEMNKTRFALLYIDLDRFKNVNDCLGHDCGDLLLQQVANRLNKAVNKTATVARIGGDEFAIIIRQSDVTELEQIATYLLKNFEAPFSIKDHDIYSTPSIGISVYPGGGGSTKDLLKSADAAMYLAKEEGKNKYKFFNPSLNERMLKKIDLEARLRKGLEEGHFSLFYQPQVDLRTEEIVGVEALVRLEDPEKGMISPAEFIPIAEETGLIEPIGQWVMKTACHQLKKWQEKGLSNVSISVNVSMGQLHNPNFVSEVANILNETQLEPQYLKIEMTESILSDLHKTAKILNEFKDLGIQIAIDDFGTGYSSLSYLKNLPVSCLKIDKAFIDELTLNTEGPIVKTIIDMGRNMNFTVIAEGVEREEHATFLKENKCFLGQGYLFSRPIPALEMECYLMERVEKIS